MAKEIFTGVDSSIPHKQFIGWLNSLLTDYKSGVWDKAVKNLLEMVFIREVKFLMIELFYPSGEGEPLGYLVIMPTDTRKSLMLLMTGSEVNCYNSEDMENFISFTTDGNITNFQENLVLDLKNPVTKQKEAEVFISIQKCFGMLLPKLFIRDTAINEIKAVGVLDIDYEGRKSGSYIVETSPIDIVKKIAITNITGVKMKLSIPIVTDFTLDVEINSKETITIPNTKLSNYFVRNSVDLDTFEYKIL